MSKKLEKAIKKITKEERKKTKEIKVHCPMCGRKKTIRTTKSELKKSTCDFCGLSYHYSEEDFKRIFGS